MHVLIFAVAYFAAVFAGGVVLGVGRVLWLVPAAGERLAELLELPLMVAASYFAASALLARSRRALGTRGALAAGLAALALPVAAELGAAFGLRGLTPAQYVASRDPGSGVAYAAALLIFALLPMLIVRRRR